MITIACSNQGKNSWRALNITLGFESQKTWDWQRRRGIILNVSTMINIYKYKWQFMLRNKEFGDMWEELKLYVVYSVTPMGNRDLKVLVI